MTRLPTAFAAGLLLCGGGTTAQSIDPGPARATLGEPVSLQIRVRAADGWPALRPSCIRAELVIGDTLIDTDQLDIDLGRDPSSSWQQLSITHPTIVTEPALEVRLSMACGPQFQRRFMVMADPSTISPVSKQRRAAPTRQATREPAGRREPDRIDPTPVPQGLRNRETASAMLVGHRDATASPVTPLAAPAAAPREAFLMEELDRVREELRRTQTSLGSVQSRIGRVEGGGAPWLWTVTGAAGGLLAASLLGTFTRLRSALGPRRRVVPRESLAFKSSMSLRPTSTLEAPTPSSPAAHAIVGVATPQPPAKPSDSSAGNAAGLDRSRDYAHADFGQPSLDDPPEPDLLRKAEGLVARGFPGGALTLLEHALHQRTGKDPWLLLCLLDLYGEMGQPWNQERVAAQLEVLYNVRIPALESADIEGHGLEGAPHVLDALQRQWGKASCLDTLASMLLRDEFPDRLDLAAFRDTLLLHAIVRAQRSDGGGPEPFDPLIDWSPPV